MLNIKQLFPKIFVRVLIIITNKCLKCSFKEKGEEELMMLVFKVLDKIPKIV